MARSIAAGKAGRLSRLSQFARNESGAHPADAEKHRSRLGRLSAAGEFPDVLFTQPDLSGKSASRAGANPRPRRIFHRVSLGLSDPPHQPLRPRLHSRWPAISRRHRSLSRLRSESSRRTASFEMAAGEARVRLSERSGIRRRVHPRLSGLRQGLAVISITRLDTAEIKTAAPAQPASPKRLHNDARPPFRGNANPRMGTTLCRSMPRTKFARVPSLVHLCRCRARF